MKNRRKINKEVKFINFVKKFDNNRLSMKWLLRNVELAYEFLERYNREKVYENGHSIEFHPDYIPMTDNEPPTPKNSLYPELAKKYYCQNACSEVVK